MANKLMDFTGGLPYGSNSRAASKLFACRPSLKIQRSISNRIDSCNCNATPTFKLAQTAATDAISFRGRNRRRAGLIGWRLRVFLRQKDASCRAIFF